MRSPRDLVRCLLPLLFASASLWLTACGDSGASGLGCTEGAEGCGCAAGRLCDPGLSCDVGRCVLPPAPDVSQSDLVGLDTASPDASGADAPPDCSAQPAAPRCPCSDNADCASGYCVPSRDGGSVCTETCESECDGDLACAFVTLPGTDPVYLCVEPALNLCRPCTRDDDCARGALGERVGRCVRYGEAAGNFCGLACSVDGDCPQNYACRDVPALETGAPARQCVLADPQATCACSGRAIEASAWTACTSEGCEGTRVCRPDGLTACLDAEGAVCEAVAEVSVTFDARGGTTPSPSVRTFTVSEPYGPLPATSRTGYIAAGWWTGPDATGEAATPEARVTRREAYTLFAAWTAERYVVTLDAEGGSTCPPVTVSFGSPYGPLCIPTRAGYAFGGWFEGDDGRGARVLPETVVSTPRDHTLHAAWTASAVTVSYDAEGGTPCEARAVTVGQPYGIHCVPTRMGYSFTGWFDGDGGTGAQVDAASVVATAADHTLHARWEARVYTLTYDSEGGSACPSREVTFGAPYGIHCVPTRTGYTFTGWYDGDGGTGTPVDAASLVATAANHTLHARWEARVYTLTYDSEGGSACPSRDVTFGAPYGIHCVPTRSGYTFTGWYDGDGGTGTPVDAASVVATAANHTLHARWQGSGVEPAPGFVVIPAGTFIMGSPVDELGRGTNEGQVSVTLTKAFFLETAEVTQAQWKALSGGVNPSGFAGDTLPVEYVSWWSTFGYLNARSATEGLNPCYILPTTKPDGGACTGTWQAGTLDCGDAMPAVNGGNVYNCTGYRLPTEAEWEYAARAGTTAATYGGNLNLTGNGCVTLTGAGPFPSGTALADLAWYACNNMPFGAKIVRSKASNAWGLHDMLGNVWEWTWDRASEAAASGTNPQNAGSGSGRVVRGGSWGVGPGSVRAAHRGGYPPRWRNYFIGFRVARSIP
jgi:uncharacterized repeat protein (TIGR02543 family)